MTEIKYLWYESEAGSGDGSALNIMLVATYAKDHRMEHQYGSCFPLYFDCDSFSYWKPNKILSVK